MIEHPAPEWARFRIGAPQRTGFAPNCVPFSTMAQVTHRETALTIMREGVLRAALVSDESRLNTSRIRVTWLSPNFWATGFRYGNVRFVYDWATLWAGMPAYWVEVIAYGISACRILLTDRPPDDPVLAGLAPYDPTRGDGPWWFDAATNQHYFNGTYTLELMVERDLPLARCQMIDFVDHHQQMCNIDPYACPDRGLQGPQAGGQVIAAMVARGITVPMGLLTHDDAQRITPNPALERACTKIWSDLFRIGSVCTGAIDQEHASAAALSRALLGAYARSPDGVDVQRLAALFQSRSALIRSCTMAVAEAFGIADHQVLDADGWAAG